MTATPSAEPAAPAAGGVPMSRREARQAAAEAAARSTSASAGAAAAPAGASAAASATGETAGRAPASGGAGSAASRTTGVFTGSAEDDDPARSWPFSGEVAAAPALPYSRTGGIPVIQADATARSRDTFDSLFDDHSAAPASGIAAAPKEKRKRRVGRWIALGIVVVLLGGVTAGGLWVWNTYEDKIREIMGWEEPKDYPPGQATGEALVTIQPGDTGQSISPKLFEAGVTKTPDAFYDYLIHTDQNPPFVPGVFRLQTQMTSEAALAAILDPSNKLENTATIPEGYSVEQTIAVLSESLGIPLEDFQAAVADPTAYGVSVDPSIAAAGGQPLEGWLFPATYEFEPGTTARDVIGRLVTQTVDVLGNLGVPEADRQRLLTTASIIQREARYEADMQKVSRVIQNRLDPNNQETFGLLQMDSTAQYGYGEMHAGSVSTTDEAQYDDNPWNTYVHAGLPIGPISNPGEVAIRAAMNPAEGDWLYFVTVNLDTGETVFTSNIDDHNAAVEQWRAWCSDHPDSGC
ncbi:endolytic transglycosylase MltG [Microbacterium sp. BWT-B31]|uniref:endolytic transglycosylase MltG n=1 Tax=Microbacterium sp. BWT-B31 TaxID=3232072 RepID=UPI003528ADFC